MLQFRTRCLSGTSNEENSLLFYTMLVAFQRTNDLFFQLKGLQGSFAIGVPPATMTLNLGSFLLRASLLAAVLVVATPARRLFEGTSTEKKGYHPNFKFVPRRTRQSDRTKKRQE